ncbi:Dor1-domain-containing protein [Phellopilus nigrolimitatus]|nr:Dor1-domain-containing protein [Phellopilus nigrolimitatus]
MSDNGLAADETLADVLVGSSNGEGSSSLRTRFSSPEISQYLSHLTSLGLPEILHEPTTLASEASQLTNSLTSLCHAEYPTFLSLHRTSAVLSTTISSFSASLSSLVSALPALEGQARQFSQETHTIQDARTKARQVLAQHDALVDVLDVPQLIDTCVRNAYYQEAMNLSAHASRLADKFPWHRAEAAHAMRLMLAQLLALLRDSAKLPALFKAVSFLRKMGVLDELELALVFLTSRLVNLNSTIDNIEKERTDHARYVRRYIDVWREGVYDVATQYTTIFLDRAPSEELALEFQYLLSTLTHHMLDALIAVLGACLPKVEDATSLSALLTQLTHCATALARVGLDFRSLLPPLFEDAVQRRFAHTVETATDAFLSTLTDAHKYSRQPSAVLCTSAVVSAPPEDTTLPDALHVPPHILASYPPLAVYTNALLAALNSLRLLAPVSLLRVLLCSLDQMLERAASGFLVYAQVSVDTAASRIRTYSEDEEPPDQARIVKAAGKVFARVLIPYSRRALIEGVYGVTEHDGLVMGSKLQDSLLQWDTWLAPPDSGSGS